MSIDCIVFKTVGKPQQQENMKRILRDKNAFGFIPNVPTKTFLLHNDSFVY